MNRLPYALMPGRQRRRLNFDDLSQVLPEVLRLKPAHRAVGRWTLGQTCYHLAAGINGSIEGLDLSRHRFKRLFFAKRILQHTFSFGIPANYTVDPNIEPPAGVDLEEAIGELACAIERYRAHPGPLHAHPLFGKMSRNIWDKVHCIHCAHHLSFIVPAI